MPLLLCSLPRKLLLHPASRWKALLPSSGGLSRTENADQARDTCARGAPEVTSPTSIGITPSSATEYACDSLMSLASSDEILRQFKCQQVVAKETDFQKERADRAYKEVTNLRIALELVTQERDTNAKENENLLRDLIDLQSQLTRKEAQNHELLKKEKKLKERLKYEDARFQKINASYNTAKGTLTALLQNQEPAAAIASTSNSATVNTLAALQEELQTEKLQRQLLVSGFMSQTAQHEAKVKQLELAQAKADLELQKQQIEALNKGKKAVGSLASTSQISQAETHLHIQLPPMPEMPDFPSTQEEEQQRPAPGALDVREVLEQRIEDMPKGLANEYLLYEKKVMESVALAFLQPEGQVKDLGHNFLPLPLMRNEAILQKEKMRPAVPQNEEGDYEEEESKKAANDEKKEVDEEMEMEAPPQEPKVHEEQMKELASEEKIEQHIEPEEPAPESLTIVEENSMLCIREETLQEEYNNILLALQNTLLSAKVAEKELETLTNTVREAKGERDSLIMQMMAASNEVQTLNDKKEKLKDELETVKDELVEPETKFKLQEFTI
ncbi:hypothetical protein L7F22_061110 [Adiantum nelumboides]|nr:hypothetical protein [Adiantum nelumboides]